jgi:hypothetical protein
MVQRKMSLHTQKPFHLLVELAKRLQKLLPFVDPPCAELLEPVTRTVPKRNTNMREAVTFSQRLFIIILIIIIIIY